LTQTQPPQLSVILATTGDFTTIRRTVEHLHNQTISDQLELVIVTASPQSLKLDAAATAGFAAVRVISVKHIQTIASANAAGIREASAPIIALAEDHSFPEPNWAAELLSAHKTGEYAAVGPRVLNANPNSAISRADYWIGYGRWSREDAGGEIDILPGHNSSYRRDLLLALGDKLESWLESETVLHWHLREQGHRLYLHTPARTHHVNFSLAKSFFGASFYNGRVFAGARSSTWSPLKRLIYTFASVLIPVIRLWRILRYAENIDFTGVMVLFAGLVVSATGEMIGYALGIGSAREQLRHYEFFRVRHVCHTDVWI